MNKVKTVSKIRLSLEPAYQIIYWSICWFTLFLSLILFLEKQHPIVSFFVVSSWLLLLYFGLGSSVKCTKETLHIRYFRGIKNNSYSLSTVTKLVLSDHRITKLERSDGKESLILYVNKKNKKNFLFLIQQFIPNLEVEKILVINKNERHPEKKKTIPQ